MTSPQDRAQRIQNDFEDLLSDLAEQDAALEALCEHFGVRREDLPEPEGADLVLAAFEEAAEACRHALLRQRERLTIHGLALRA